MKKLRRLLISILYILIIVNCKLEVPIEEPENNVIEIEEQVIMNDFIVKPFTEYPAYYVQGNAVSGIPADAKGPGDMIRFLPEIEIDEEDFIDVFDTFFVKDGKVYFTISSVFPPAEPDGDLETIVKYCTLKDGEVVYLTKAKFPAMPESVRVKGNTGVYAIDIGDYQGDPISVLDNGSYTEKFTIVDGFLEIEGGLLIHTPTGRGSSRPAGLLFWPEGLRTMNSWKEVGRFWK